MRSICSECRRYHDHGDTIAIQYGGSHLVNTMETYRKINQWTSHSRDMVESFKRYYNNSFLDGQRQEAYNLFLGNYIFTRGQPMLWDLSTDYYLHHADPRAWSAKSRRSYIQWFTPSYLLARNMPPTTSPNTPRLGRTIQHFDDYWLEYYRPLAISSFQKTFSYRMNSTLRYIPFRSTQEGRFDLSPFHVRTSQDSEIPDKPRPKKGVKILEPSDQPSEAVATLGQLERSHFEPDSLQSSPLQSSILKSAPGGYEDVRTTPKTPNTGSTYKDKAAMTLGNFITNSLDPSVSASEMDEYGRYISHPLNLPLVVSSDTSPAQSLEFLNYIQSASTVSAFSMHTAEEDIADFAAFLSVEDEPLTVTEADTPKKRYKAYRQWLKGKSLFKQSRSDF